MQRRDEFDGEIAVSVEGLPPGVTCPGAVLGGGVTEGSLVLVAAEDASAWAGPIKIVAKARIGGREVAREARYARRRVGHAEPAAAAGGVSPRAGAVAGRDRQGDGAGAGADRRGQGV